MPKNVDPTRQQFDEFKALPRDTPIMMLNLIKLRTESVYPDGTVVSGAEAYQSYGRESDAIFERVGGEIIWRGKPESVVTGPLDEQWDIAFIARYPNAKSFLAMVTDEDYKKVVVHRQLAVEDSRLIRMGEAEAGSGFSA
jgi:uncharacterized protein (DUF1330 family)